MNEVGPGEGADILEVVGVGAEAADAGGEGEGDLQIALGILALQGVGGGEGEVLDRGLGGRPGQADVLVEVLVVDAEAERLGEVAELAELDDAAAADDITLAEDIDAPQRGDVAVRVIAVDQQTPRRRPQRREVGAGEDLRLRRVLRRDGVGERGAVASCQRLS